MDSLVTWKKKTDLFFDEMDEDETDIRVPKLTDTIQEPKFIHRDSTNARALKTMRCKW